MEDKLSALPGVICVQTLYHRFHISSAVKPFSSDFRYNDRVRSTNNKYFLPQNLVIIAVGVVIPSLSVTAAVRTFML